MQTLAELGVPGLILLIGLLAVPFAGARARRHPLVPVVLGAHAALLVHAVYDWDWQLPAVMLAGLLCGLAALVEARRDDSVVNIAGRGRLILLAAFAVGAAFAFVALVLKARQIAELLGERTNTVEVAQHRALRRLRIELDAEPSESGAVQGARPKPMVTSKPRRLRGSEPRAPREPGVSSSSR